MTPEATACQTLLGEKIGSIRSIHYLPDIRSTLPAGLGALEIETKTGRFVHVTPTDAGGCLIASGPVPIPLSRTRPSVRHWADLTTETSFAFDGRPVVARVEPITRHGRTRGCSIEFSSGARQVYEVSEGQPRLAQNAKNK